MQQSSALANDLFSWEILKISRRPLVCNEVKSWVLNLYSVLSGTFTRREGHGAKLVILIDYRSDS